MSEALPWDSWARAGKEAWCDRVWDVQLGRGLRPSSGGARRTAGMAPGRSDRKASLTGTNYSWGQSKKGGCSTDKMKTEVLQRIGSFGNSGRSLHNMVKIRNVQWLTLLFGPCCFTTPCVVNADRRVIKGLVIINYNLIINYNERCSDWLMMTAS